LPYFTRALGEFAKFWT